MKKEKNQTKKSYFEILFKDSPDYFILENSKMVQEDKLLRFICFCVDDNYSHDVWFPIENIHRIKRNMIQRSLKKN